jgi:DNA invertase Pin-like site-specific DNA recombinase
LIGRARVSMRGQGTHLHLDAFAKAGASDIRQEKGGSVGSGPGLQKVLASLIAGGVLVVCKIDRVARSLRDLLSILDRIQASGAAIRSLPEPLDTPGPIGAFMVQVLGAVA